MLRLARRPPETVLASCAISAEVRRHRFCCGLRLESPFDELAFGLVEDLGERPASWRTGAALLATLAAPLTASETVSGWFRRTFCDRSCRRIRPLRPKVIALSIALESSRTLHGHEYLSSPALASCAIPVTGTAGAASALKILMKWLVSRGMSSDRSCSGGIWMTLACSR